MKCNYLFSSVPWTYFVTQRHYCNRQIAAFFHFNLFSLSSGHFQRSGRPTLLYLNTTTGNFKHVGTEGFYKTEQPAPSELPLCELPGKHTISSLLYHIRTAILCFIWHLQATPVPFNANDAYFLMQSSLQTVVPCFSSCCNVFNQKFIFIIYALFPTYKRWYKQCSESDESNGKHFHMLFMWV